MVSTHRFRRDLPEVPDARAFVASAVEAQDMAASDDLLLVTSELVTNAVRHGDGEVEVRVEVGPATVRIEVVDDGDVVVPEPPAVIPVDGPGGWGLHLVRAVSQAWGSGLDAHGRTLVWAEVAVPARRSAGSPAVSAGR
jgi:anti-sigma regulatory factor (Ser/Thr protein kinase)